MTTPFLLLPNGTSPRVETISHLTRIAVGLNGYETRKPKRAYPRLRYSAGFLALNAAQAAELAPLAQSGAELLVPLAQHRFESADGTSPTPDAIYLAGQHGQFLVQGADGVRRLEGGLVGQGAIPGWQPGDLWAIPVVAARAFVASETVQLEALTNVIRQTQVEFVCLPLDEQLPAYQPTHEGYPLLEQRHNWRVKPQESLTHTFIAFDEGNVADYHAKYVKRGLELEVLLQSRAAITEFRSFIYTVQGACRSFAFRSPLDGVVKLYRLATDDQAIEYYKPRLAVAKLALVEVSQ